MYHFENAAKLMILVIFTIAANFGCVQIDNTENQVNMTGTIQTNRIYDLKGIEKSEILFKDSKTSNVYTLNNSEEISQLQSLESGTVSIEGTQSGNSIQVESLKIIHNRLTSSHSVSRLAKKLLFVNITFNDSKKLFESEMRLNKVIDELNRSLHYSSYGKVAPYSLSKSSEVEVSLDRMSVVKRTNCQKFEAINEANARLPKLLGENSVKSFDYIIYYIYPKRGHSGICNGAAGEATFKQMFLYEPNIGVVVHEHGHSNGLHHSGFTKRFFEKDLNTRLPKTASLLEYGDDYSSMGYGRTTKVYNGPHRYISRWLPDENIYKLTNNENRELEIDLQTVDSFQSLNGNVKLNGFKMIKVGEHLLDHVFLSYRHNVNENGVLIPGLHRDFSKGILTLHTMIGPGLYHTKIIKRLINISAGKTMEVNLNDYIDSSSAFTNLRVEVLSVNRASNGYSSLRIKISNSSANSKPNSDIDTLKESQVHRDLASVKSIIGVIDLSKVYSRDGNLYLFGWTCLPEKSRTMYAHAYGYGSHGYRSLGFGRASLHIDRAVSGECKTNGIGHRFQFSVENLNQGEKLVIFGIDSNPDSGVKPSPLFNSFKF